MRHTSPYSREAVSDRDAKIIEEYRERLRELQPLWNRNFLWFALPGFLLFVIGGPGGLLLPGGKANDNLWLIIPGIVLFMIGVVRGVLMMSHYRRCPVCDKFQPPEVRIPYRTCLRCGTRLTYSWKEIE